MLWPQDDLRFIVIKLNDYIDYTFFNEEKELTDLIKDLDKFEEKQKKLILEYILLMIALQIIQLIF